MSVLPATSDSPRVRAPVSEPDPAAVASPGPAPAGPFTPAAAPATAAGGSRVRRVRHELKRREVTVVRVEDLGARFKRITFGGDALAGFVSASFDDHVKFIIDGADANAAPIGRDYTPRHHDPVARELTIEFALHGEGPAAAWAARATVGSRATIGGPRGSFIIPLDHDWHLLVGDETALPAIARRLEELPTGARAIVVCQATDPGDRRTFASSADVAVDWVADAEALVAAVEALVLPAGEGYAWCAGEAGTMMRVRRILVDGKGHPRHAMRAAAYWKGGATAHHENLED